MYVTTMAVVYSGNNYFGLRPFLIFPICQTVILFLVSGMIKN